MQLIFGQVNTRLAGKYDAKDDPRGHIYQWTAMWGEDPTPEWVHTFVHTLHVVPMKW